MHRWSEINAQKLQTLQNYKNHAVLIKQDRERALLLSIQLNRKYSTTHSRTQFTYNFSESDALIFLLDTSSVCIGVQEECTHVPLWLVWILLCLTLLLRSFVLTDVVVVQAIFVRTHFLYSNNLLALQLDYMISLFVFMM